jgi:hypothetical protein
MLLKPLKKMMKKMLSLKNLRHEHGDLALFARFLQYQRRRVQ